jgi:CTP:phosphocholine cytidylyltransferase-like protein
MKREELLEYLNEYRDANSEQQLIQLLKQKLVEELETWETVTDRQRHDLNMMIRDLEEELDYIESEKLAEFDPEQQ